MKKKKETKKTKTAPSKKHFAKLKKNLLEFMEGKNYRPLNRKLFYEKLAIPKSLQRTLDQVIDSLMSEGVIYRNQTGYLLTESKNPVLSGTLSLHPKGFGFVKPENAPPGQPDIFIPKHLISGAIDGDVVQIEQEAEVSSKGPEGRIIAILKRKRSELTGVVTSKVGKKYIAIAKQLGPTKQILLHPSKKVGVKVGDRIRMRVLHWQDKHEKTECEVLENLGTIEDPSIDTKVAIQEFEILQEFSPQTLDDLKKQPKEVTKKDWKGREDFTKLECVTIDPTTARDFDDAITLTKDQQGNFHLGVHIADVSYYVKPGSAIDEDAYKRCNSTYFPNQCVPMLPEALSNEICSLKPEVDRLTVSVMMTLDSEGEVLHYKICRGVIHSKKRFTYEEALQVLEKKKKSPYLPLLQRMEELCYLFKKKRKERGSIDFSLPDIVVSVDKKGVPTGVKVVEYDITHQMIEEFMLKANEVVATHLSEAGKSLLFRIHEEPSADSFQDFYTLARSLGFKLPKEPDYLDIQKLFDRAKSSPYFSQLSIGFIRSMKLAMYSPQNIGHYGLSLTHYAHFTSPIRRYSDLVIHRLLFDEHPEEVNLEQIAEKCSEQERTSFRAESSVLHLKKLRLLKQMYEEDPVRHYQAFVTKIKPYALFFEITDIFLEGSLHVSELEEDYFNYDPKLLSLVGRRTHKSYKYGDKITVELLKVDLIAQETRWAIISKRK